MDTVPDAMKKINVERMTEERVLMMGDWYHRDSETLQKWYQSAYSNGFEVSPWLLVLNALHRISDFLLSTGTQPVPDSALVNGQQQYNCSLSIREIDCLPEGGVVPTLHLNPKKRNQFRLINTGSVRFSPRSVFEPSLKLTNVELYY